MEQMKKYTGIDKFLRKSFEHFRNYIICAGMLTAGLSAVSHPDWVLVGSLGAAAGVLVIGIAIGLALLNSWTILVWISRELQPVNVPGTSRKRGHGFRAATLAMYLAVVYILIAMSVNLSSVSRISQGPSDGFHADADKAPHR